MRMKLIDGIDLDDLPLPDHQAASGTDGANATAAETKAKKKKPKKKKAAKSSDKAVKWGNVEQICFSRSIGYDRIPNKGVYPIGLGVEKERILSTIDELYTAQQQHLLQRAVAKGLHFKAADAPPPPPPPVNSPSPQLTSSKGGKKGQRHRSNSVSSVGSVDATPVDDLDALQPLETRQYDYKGQSNPLFQALGEDERIALLTSDSVDIVADPSHAHANPLTEVNNELKHLKSLRESSGCTCKHVKTDKLSMAKMRSELFAKKHLICYEATVQEIDKLPKADLTKKMKEVLKHCALCVANDCQCVQQGIQCSAQLCGCLRGGHNPDQGQACANPEGIDLYDPERVKRHRKSVLQALGGIGPSAAENIP